MTVKRSRFASSSDTGFRFDLGSGIGTVSGQDNEFFSKLIGGNTFKIKDFPISILGMSDITEISMIGTQITPEHFLTLLISEIVHAGGFAELNSGKGKKHVKYDNVRLYHDYISIQHGGAFNTLMEMGIQGGKQVLLDNITAIQIKPFGFAAGYLQFSIKGEVASKGGLFSAVGDENTVTTYGKFGSLIACAIRNYIFDWQRAHRPIK